MQTMLDKSEFLNTTQGWLGVVRINRIGEENGIAVAPGERVFLSRDEQVATANAPNHPDNNPFVAKAYTTYDDKTGDVLDTGVRAPLELVEQTRQTPDRELAAAMAPEGSFAAGEEADPVVEG